MSLRVVTWPAAGSSDEPATSSRPRRQPSWGRLDRRTVVPAALLLWALVALGDVITTAEVAFTLLYLAPVGLAVWYRGKTFGIVLAVLSTASGLATWLLTSHLGVGVVAWNVLCELGVLTAFTVLLATLRGRVAEESKGRETAVAQLRHAERLTTVGKLAAGVAHELGTPLNVVAGRAALIEDGRVHGDAVLRSAGIIRAQAQRMAEIIQGLLAFARRGTAEKAPTDVSLLLRETAALLQPMARAKHVELVCHADRPKLAAINAGEIQQVLSNLVVNAQQAMPNGGHITLSVVTRRLEPGIVRLRVEDDGPGIPPEVLPHIFDPFFTTKEVGEGTGLGLSVAYGIVRDHGGWFEVSTETGRGTAFEACLPVAAEDDGHEND